MPLRYSVHPPDKHKPKGLATNFYIRIDEGEYEGVEYSYLNVKNLGIDEDDNAHLTYDYDVLYSPIPEVIKVDFEAVLWDILKDILNQVADSIPDIAVPETVDELDETRLDEFQPEELLPDKE